MGMRYGPHSLKTVFIQYLLWLVAATVGLVVITLVLLGILVNSGLMLKADYMEQWINRHTEQISGAQKVTRELFPEGIDYAVYDRTTRDFLYGSIKQSKAQEIMEAVLNGKWYSGGFLGLSLGAEYYKVIARQGEFCIVVYPIAMQYPSVFLRKHLPPLEWISLLIFILTLLAAIIMISSWFGRKISRNLKHLQKSAEQIQNGKLDFSVTYSGIQEIDSVLHSFDRMRYELKDSLERQWRIEQAGKEQTSALAHDIKTPLTVIRGNAELIAELNPLDEAKEYTGYILKSTAQIERYVQLLIDASRSEDAGTAQMQAVNMEEFLTEIERQTEALAAPKQLRMEFVKKDSPHHFTADSELLQRAIINLLANAVDYSPAGGTIRFSVESVNGKLRFSVADQGPGFTAEQLVKAKEPFYIGDASRSGQHYGLGLSIASSIAGRHGGTLEIRNFTNTGGGEAIIEFPLSTTT